MEESFNGNKKTNLSELAAMLRGSKTQCLRGKKMAILKTTEKAMI